MTLYTSTEIFPKIFVLEFDNEYDTAMHFLRLQETYENPDFKNKKFSILEFMEFYAKKYGEGAFTYTTDYSGFNLPGNFIKNFNWDIPDWNKYDVFMYHNLLDIINLYDDQFYIIGVTKGGNAIDHELAHAMYYLHPSYKEEMDSLISKHKNSELYTLMIEYFIKNMYESEVFEDEFQAYMSTSTSKSLQKYLDGSGVKYKGIKKQFHDKYREFVDKLRCNH